MLYNFLSYYIKNSLLEPMIEIFVRTEHNIKDNIHSHDNGVLSLCQLELIFTKISYTIPYI